MQPEKWVIDAAKQIGELVWDSGEANLKYGDLAAIIARHAPKTEPVAVLDDDYYKNVVNQFVRTPIERGQLERFFRQVANDAARAAAVKCAEIAEPFKTAIGAIGPLQGVGLNQAGESICNAIREAFNIEE